MPTLAMLNAADPAALREDLLKCCHASRWAQQMIVRRPYRNAADLFEVADQIWGQMGAADILEAFGGHPRIGDLAALREKFQATAAWAEGEQAGTSEATEDTLRELAAGNRAYEARFGHIFIVCATGKSAAEMLALLNARLNNPPDAELRIAAAEQAKITRIRLEKLLAP